MQSATEKIRKNKLFVNLLLIGILSALIAAAYANTINSPFIMDDDHTIVQNPFIKIDDLSVESLKHSLKYSGNRWLPTITFALNYYIGGLDVSGYHFFNIFIHIAASAVLFFLAKTTLSLVGNKALNDNRLLVAFFAAALWALHPVQTNAVTYIVQRMTSMAGLFYMLCMLLYIYGRQCEGRTIIRKILLYLGSMLCALCAISSKQTAAMLPIMILAYEVYFFKPAWLYDRRKMGMISLVALAVALTIGWFMGGGAMLVNLQENYKEWDFTLSERLMTESRVIFLYLSLLVLPLPSRLRFDYDYEISKGLLVPPQTLFSIIGIGVLIYLIFVLFKRHRLASFGLLWFLGNLVIESTIIPLDIIFEHRLYLPSVFLILGFVAMLAEKCNEKRLPALRTALIAVVCTLAVFTWQRNSAWSSSLSLWTDVVAKSPRSTKGYINLSIEKRKSGEIAEAENLLLQALEVEPDNGVAMFNLAQVYDQQGRYGDAIKVLQEALTTDNVNITVTHSLLADIYLASGDYPNAIKESDVTLSRNSQFAQNHVTKGIAYEKLGDSRKALLEYESAWKKGIKSALLFTNWAISARNLGLDAQATDLLTKAISIDPGKIYTYLTLSKIFEEQERIDEAIRLLQMGLTNTRENNAALHNRLGELYLRKEKLNESVEHSQKALANDPGYISAFVTLGRAYEKAGQHDTAIRYFETAAMRGLNSLDLLMNLAISQLSANMNEQAITTLQRAQRIAPQDPDVIYTLSLAYKRTGQEEQSQKLLEQHQEMIHRK